MRTEETARVATGGVCPCLASACRGPAESSGPTNCWFTEATGWSMVALVANVLPESRPPRPRGRWWAAVSTFG